MYKVVRNTEIYFRSNTYRSSLFNWNEDRYDTFHFFAKDHISFRIMFVRKVK